MSVEEKKVAILLATHKRIGGDSPLLGLGSDKDALRVVVEFAFPKWSLEGFEGILENSFGKKGEGEGGFNSLTFLVFDSAGNLVVCDSDNKQDQWVSPEGRLTDLVVCNSWNKRIQWVSPEGNFLKSLPLGFEPRGLAFLSEETLVIADVTNDQIRFISVEDGRTLRRIGKRGNGKGEFEIPEDVAVDSEHEQIFVVDCWNHRVQVLSSSGEFVRSFGKKGSGEGELRFPTGVAIDPEDRSVVVTDSGNQRVVVFSQEGRWLRSFGKEGKGEGEFNYPRAVAVDCDGNVVVSDCSNHRVQLFSRGGDFLKSFGKEGEGEFKFPFGVAIDEDGRIAVVDRDNSRIQIFS